MKKLVSLLLVMVMVLSVFSIVPFTANAANTNTVYLINSANWTNVYAYAWNSTLLSTDNVWPGMAMQSVGVNSQGAKVYSIAVPGEYDMIIFNGGEYGPQTSDLNYQVGMGYDNSTNNWVSVDDIIVEPDMDPTSDPNPDPEPDNTKTIYFQNNWLWTDVKVYYWGSSSTNSAEWPGEEARLVGNDGMYDVYAATVPTDIEGIIFNGYDAEIGSTNQTPDIIDSKDGNLYYMIWDDVNNRNNVGKMYIDNILPKQTTLPTESGATSVDDLFVKVGDQLYKVNKGDTFTYNYYLSVDSALKISSLDINMFYDTVGLDLVPFTDEYGDVDLEKHFPKIYGGVVHNFAIDGEIYYNYSKVAGVRLADNSLVFTAQFKVTADKGVYEISEKLVTLADSDMNKIVFDKEVLQPDVFTDNVELSDAVVVIPGTEPVVTEPTESEATEPETTPVVDNGLYVVADGVKYAVKKGDVVTYNYYLSVDSSLKISSLDINMFYDSEGLEFKPYTDGYGDADLEKHFPNIYGGVVHNFDIDGEIYYNYSKVAGVRLANEALVFTGQFKVTADKGTYNINSKMITLADSNMNKIVYAEKVVQPDVFTVKTEIGDAAVVIPGTEPVVTEPTQTEPTENPTNSDDTDDGLFVKVDGELYKVEKGDIVTYQYILNVPSGIKISSSDMNTFYDTKGLEFIPYNDGYGDADVLKHFPKIHGGVVYNFNIDGEIYYNYSSVAGVRLTNDAVIFEGQFKVTADKGTYEIYTNLVTLADSDMNKIFYNNTVIQNIYEEKEILLGLSPDDPIIPTEPEGLYIRIRDEYYEVKQGMEYTFTYYLQVEDKRIGSIDARVSYDTQGLEFIPTVDEYGEDDLVSMFPIIKSPVFNHTIDGMLYFNFATAAGRMFPEKDSVLFTGKFKVTAKEGTYDITPYMHCLADEEIDIIVDEGVVKGEYYDHGVIEPALSLGDVNRDGKVNIFDATEIQRYCALFTDLDEDQLRVADTNFDGNVNIFDVSKIMRFIVGHIPSLETK